MKASIVQRAHELGFDACRVTSAAPPESAARFQEWLAAGRHGEMGYLARNAHKRVEPQRVLHGAKSIVTLGASYSRGEVSNQYSVSSVQKPDGAATGISSPLNTEHCTLKTGIIARYARFTDYHNVLAAPLKQLAGFIDELGGPGTRSLWYVDTGPLLERDLAQRAGLGFIGKHTNLISRQLGNWFYLCEIITTLELEPDAPEKNRCGTCTRCITACPTNAIPAPFQLDARRCISYLTIELKGSIPVELRPLMGARIFGCDDCLAVCPWNRFAREASLMAPHRRRDLDNPGLLELLSLDDAGFQNQFAATPLRRVKRRGLLRNVCVALGNTADTRALPALEKASRDSEPLIAEHARWAIEQIERRRSLTS
ncbi:MAG TPA: tRNA epoxyqueuosine(34) reductase QueG [Verrucomicrobiae bacterium]|nr:tRNA epoxyqueuosine(34) reductase QueG [Verrucomicrobiae bacterium]